MTRRLAPLAVALVLLASCAGGDAEGEGDGDLDSLAALVPAPLADELTLSGRCDDGTLWATDDAGSLAVTVVPGPDGLPAEVVLPTGGAAVTVRRGDDLDTTICDDVDGPGSPATEGRLEVDRPMEECGPTSFRITGLVAEDGTTFGPIEGHDAAEGCESG